MSHQLNVHALPSLVQPEELAGGVAVVIDVLRASTTMVHALQAGAAEIIPCEEVEEARRLAASLPAAQVLLGGEREGLPIEGFDLGNSPEEYESFRVAGRTIVFTTTNGTRALARCRQADQLLVGAFVNVSAVLERLLPHPVVHLVCAGTRGEFSRDDILLAGLLVERLQRGGVRYELNAQAITARENWLSSFALPVALGGEPLDPELLAAQLRETPGGRNLVALGLDQDIRAAAQIDRFAVVPVVGRDFHIRLEE